MSDQLADDARQIRDTACDAVLARVRTGAAAEDAAIEPFVRDLFEKYFAASQQKKEPPEIAAAKISKLVLKQAQNRFPPAPSPQAEPEPAPAPAEAAGAGAEPNVTGKTAGIDRKILNVLSEISAFYGRPIQIVSGLRTQAQQAQAMYTNWQSHLRRGKDNAHLAKAEKLRVTLDQLKQEKRKDLFVETLTKTADWSALTRHMDGSEVDLPASTEPEIVAALATCLNHRAGRNSEGARVHHFDNSRVVWPITESTRAKWQPLSGG